MIQPLETKAREEGYDYFEVVDPRAMADAAVIRAAR